VSQPRHSAGMGPDHDKSGCLDCAYDRPARHRWNGYSEWRHLDNDVSYAILGDRDGDPYVALGHYRPPLEWVRRL
jgi:hypothetical protein